MIVALGACATDSASRGELNELVSSVRALRAENARLEARLDKLEQQSTVTSTRKSVTAAASTTSAAPAPSPSAEVPQLAVVKLKPRVQAAPKINTRVEVAEPAETIVDELKAPDRAEAEAEAAMAEAAYSRGLDALKTGNAESGMAQLLQFVSDSPRHPHADNALYYVGLAQMAQQDFAGALQEFERVLSQYPAGDSVIDAMLKLGECRVRLKQPQLARATWEKIISSFPGTPGAAQAQTNLAALSTSKTP